MTVVSIQKAENYDLQTVYDAVCMHFDALDIRRELTPDMKVLLKPNMLLAKSPDGAATTHPVLLRAVAVRLRELGIKRIVLADSSGGLYNERTLKKTYEACGFSTLADLLELNFDTASQKRGKFQIITPVLEADYIINCAKLKTHALMVMTAAVKNMFGSVPGIKKAEYHCTKATVEPFTRMLLDLHETVKPHLNLVDAIDCMEGNGPSGGTVRHMGITLASKCAYAADEVCAELMQINPQLVRTIHWARKRGLVQPGAVEKTGHTLTPAEPPFTLPDSIISPTTTRTGGGIGRLLWGRASTRPTVIKEKCIGCGKCAQGCPKHIISITNKIAFIPKKGCISCFCCHELCPEKAIEIIKR
ncbi:MAG: DUF362 domain-containing protein [Eubacteriales bacterium]|nr:DUF362 domain-containing protein [Eubacteriales bacterium]